MFVKTASGQTLNLNRVVSYQVATMLGDKEMYQLVAYTQKEGNGFALVVGSSDECDKAKESLDNLLEAIAIPMEVSLW
jgi:hypothetical protein